MVEQLTVNQLVAGSSPARGAKYSINCFQPVSFRFEEFLNNCINLFLSVSDSLEKVLTKKE